MGEDTTTYNDLDALVLSDTKMFVQAVIADFGACPFTIDANRAGPQKGQIRYQISHARSIEEAMYDYWKEGKSQMAA